MSGGGMFGGAAANDGVFRQEETYQENPGNPTIASDGSPLVQSLEVAFQAPGHMRVARVIRDTRKPPGQQVIEYQEQFRPPSPEEVELLKQQGVVKIGPGGVILSGLGEPGPTGGGGIAPGVLAPAPGVPGQPSVVGQPPSTLGKVVKYGAILGGVGLAGWLGYKFAWPWVSEKLFSSGDDEGEE